MNDDLARLDATAQADLVRRKEVTPSELLEAAVARVEQLNPQLNAVIHDLSEKARAAVEQADSLPDGPFRGVPFLIKDAVCHTAGDPYHCGLQVLKDAAWTEPEDTWLARRFRDAGFVIFGKTNLPELASAITTEPLAYGATHNPWNTDHSPGGSSGGAGAAVASGMVPVAHGNDMGGSIRFPAAHCGIVGLKPSRARTTLGPDFGEYWGPLTHEHVLTRTVRDTAAVLDAIAGPGVGDPYTAPAPARPWREEVGADPGRLRIGFRTAQRDGQGEAHPDVVAGVQAAARALEALGHQVELAAVPALDDPAMSETVPALFSGVIARDVDRWSAKLGRTIEPSELEPMNAVLTEMGRAVTATQFLAGMEAIQAWSRRVAAWWEDFDVLVLPVSPQPPPRLGELSAEGKDGLTLLVETGGWTTFTFPFNMTGQPAISLPLHWTPDGLPVGVQFVAGYGREDVLIRLASQLEQAMPWADRLPPVHA